MANNQTLFSVAIPLDKVEEKEWCEAQLTFAIPDAILPMFNDIDLQGDAERWEQIRKAIGLEWKAPTEAIDTEEVSQFSYNIDDDEILIFAEESGDPAAAAEFISGFLRRWDPENCMTLTWADTCDKPRVDEFSGGAIFITAEGIEVFSAGEWAAEKVKQHNAKEA